MFAQYQRYTKEDVWHCYNSRAGSQFGEGWRSDYVWEGNDFVLFTQVSIDGGNSLCSYDVCTEKLIWNGNESSHSALEIFRQLFAGEIKPRIFIRSDESEKDFIYLGDSFIDSYEDWSKALDGKPRLRITFGLTSSNKDEMLDVAQIENGDEKLVGKKQVLVNKYERNPFFRSECLRHYGYDCQVCGFSFHKVYGELGSKFCHVHHIEPISEKGGEGKIDPIVDLVPVCANCHAMLHRGDTVIKPDELRKMLNSSSNIST